MPDPADRARLRAEYAARAARDPLFRRCYHRRLRRERRADPFKHMLLIGAPSADDPFTPLSVRIAGRPELEPRWTRELPDGTVQLIATVLDYNP